MGIVDGCNAKNLTVSQLESDLGELLITSAGADLKGKGKEEITDSAKAPGKIAKTESQAIEKAKQEQAKREAEEAKRKRP